MKRSLAILTLCGLLVACPKTTGGQTNAASAQAHAELEAAKQKAAQGDSSAQADLERLQQQYANTDVAAEALFQQGELAYDKKDWATARERYRTLLGQYPLFPQADKAKYHLGLSSLALNDFRDALETLSPLYDRLSPQDKPEAAGALSKAAVGAHAWGDAVRYLADAETTLTDPAARAQVEQQLYTLVDGQVPEVEIAKLAQDLRPTSPAYALVLFKLARINFHLHNWDALKQTLQTLQQNAPNNAFSQEAQQMLERANRRDQVRANAVGVLLPLSGKWHLAGEAALSGIKLALAGSNVQLVVKDTAGDPDQAKRMVQELVLDNQVIAILGPIITSEAQAAATSADELGVPIIALSREESLTERGPYVFRNMLTNSAQARALVQYATQVRGYSSFGVLYPNITYGNELANDFWDDVLAAGGEVRAAESYDHDQTTFGPVVKKLVGRYFLEDRVDFLTGRKEIAEGKGSAYQNKKAMERLKSGLAPIIDFEALFIPDQARNVGLIAPALAVEDIVTNGCDQKDMERIAKTLGLKKATDVKSVLLLGANGWDSTDLVERGGKFVQCSVFVDGFYAESERPATQKFVKAYKDANGGRAPDLLAAYGYDSGRLARQLVEKDRPGTRDAFRDALGHVKSVTGAAGNVTVNGRNEVEHPLFFLTVDKNGIKEFNPAAEAKAGG